MCSSQTGTRDARITIACAIFVSVMALLGTLLG
jgi:hypothetical protein